MKHLTVQFSVADSEFYAPLESAADPGERFDPGEPPEGWRGMRSGVWTMWRRPGHLDGVEEGWKVHVSARPDRLAEVLRTVAAVCFARDVPFKHLSSRLFYQWTHQKFAPRQQGGKFIAAYPESVEAARALMELLRAGLAGEQGPYILTDRRYRDSRTVHYRYGAFTQHSRVQPDGTAAQLVRDGNGVLVPDRRGFSFHLPDGVTDPFRAAAAPRPAGGTGLNGFVVDSAAQHSNAGGAYLGHEVATGRKVFIKEGRPHIGVRDDDADAVEQLRAEWRSLSALHGLAPGVAPEPLAYFRVWEHEFMVTEFVPGIPLWRWLAAHHPMFFKRSTPDDFAAYYARCEAILRAVEGALERMHAVGYLFVDVSPGNVMVGEDDAVRLVDFGSAHRLGDPFILAGTPGFAPPPTMVGDDPSIYDGYGTAALAQFLTGPLNQVARINPDALAHLYHGLAELAPVPPALLRRATRFHPPTDRPRLPGPEEVAADPVRHLADLRDRVADALTAMADVDHPARAFPTVAEGYLTNTVCVAYGTAGVVRALRHAGRALPPGVTERLRRDALRAAPNLAPGAHAGAAGVARVLAECGLLDEARQLLDAADRHPLTGECATLAGGSAGVALAHLDLYRRTRDAHHLDRASALLAALPPDGELTGRLGADDATGLLHGRCGVALALQQLAAVTGDTHALDRAVALLHAELDRAVDPDAPDLTFPVSATDHRAVPYLWAGSAGLVYAATRCLRATADERLAGALPRLLAALRLPYTAQPGLYQGLSGLAFALADHAWLTGDETSRRDALRTARGLYTFALPHPTGVRFLGDQLLRYSAELWSGSAGVLLALGHVLAPHPDGLFAADPAGAPATGAPSTTPCHATGPDTARRAPAVAVPAR